jgi:hypothetical protein
MTYEEKLNFIKRYAPILWVHEKDYFLPEDCQVMEQIAKVGKSSTGMQDFTLNDLGNLSDSGDYYMDIPESDYNNFAMNADYDGPEIGPERLAAFMRKKYSNNPFMNLNARDPYPKYHARVGELKLWKGDDADSDFLQAVDPGVWGTYSVVQYYFFYLYNDSWNQHLSDWDATLEMFIKDDNSRAYSILYMHHTSWMMKFTGKPRKLKNWMDEWKGVEDKKIGKMYQYGVHPFVFVAQGAHGGYSTPGTSLHGTKLPGHKIITQPDCRQIGKICIYPNYAPVTQNAIKKKLTEAHIDAGQTKFIAWEEPIVLENQSWLNYKGLWGTKSEYSGWSGATGPKQKSIWSLNQRRFKRSLVKALHGQYKGSWPFKILDNWHGWI